MLPTFRPSGGRVLLSESATAERVELREVDGELSPSTGPAAAQGRVLVTLITPGWGSSGYYSEALLSKGMGAVFPAGTHMYLDHPTRSDDFERPERSVGQLAAVTTEAARWDAQLGGVVAEAMLFPDYRESIVAKRGSIGVSIRAYGEEEYGEAEGRQGKIITALVEGLSADFVTKAGRGGRIVELLESATVAEARNAGHWFEARIHADFTRVADGLFGDGHLTREERISLSSAIGDALTAFNATVANEAPGLYARDPFADPDNTETQVTESGRVDQPKEDIMSDENRLATLEETVRQHETQLAEADKRAAEAEQRATDADARADRAEDALLTVEAEKVVRGATVAVEGGSPASAYLGLLPRTVDRAVNAALGEALPMTDDGKLDRDKLVERAVRAAQAERDYLTEASGGSRVEGFGPSVPANGQPAAEADTSKLVESFKGLGMSDEAAKVAAEGR